MTETIKPETRAHLCRQMTVGGGRSDDQATPLGLSSCVGSKLFIDGEMLGRKLGPDCKLVLQEGNAVAGLYEQQEEAERVPFQVMKRALKQKISTKQRPIEVEDERICQAEFGGRHFGDRFELIARRCFHRSLPTQVVPTSRCPALGKPEVKTKKVGDGIVRLFTLKMVKKLPEWTTVRKPGSKFRDRPKS